MRRAAKVEGGRAEGVAGKLARTAAAGKKKQEAQELTWRNERRKISSLIEFEQNPRVLTEKQAADLAESLRKFGYVEPVAVNLDGTILGGHQRRRILLAQALVEPNAEIDVRVPSRRLSEKECAELNVRLNRNLGEWDYDKLANVFDVMELQEWGFEPWELGVAEDNPWPPSAVLTTNPQGQPAPPSSVRMVQLYLDVNTFPEFQTLVRKLADRYGTANPTDTVMAALRALAEET